MFMSPNMHMLKTDARCDGILMGLFRVWDWIRLWDWSPNEWDQCPYKRASSSVED